MFTDYVKKTLSEEFLVPREKSCFSLIGRRPNVTLFEKGWWEDGLNWKVKVTTDGKIAELKGSLDTAWLINSDSAKSAYADALAEARTFFDSL